MLALLKHSMFIKKEKSALAVITLKTKDNKTANNNKGLFNEIVDQWVLHQNTVLDQFFSCIVLK